MLQSISNMIGFSINSTTGGVGHVEDFFFDDEKWAVRYLVVDTAPLFFGRKVLMSPYSVVQVSWEAGEVTLNVSKEKIKDSPEIDTAQPVSRQHETQLNDYYDWPSYWFGGGLWWYPTNEPRAASAAEEISAEKEETGPPEEIPQTISDPHLRSANEVLKYDVVASDRKIGSVHDFSVDEKEWALRYLVVDTGILLPGKKVLVAVDWIESVSWSGSLVTIGLPPDRIKDAPEFSSIDMVSRDYEEALAKHYNRKGYWEMRASAQS